MRIWEVSLADFLLVTVFLGGGAALLTGRATAREWEPWGRLVVYVVLLTIATRFIHFSLFEGSFFLPLSNFWTALNHAAVDFVVLMVAAALGRLPTRARQMHTQYRSVLKEGASQR
jgi:hypothetical protein